jgi:long-chain acyl-CoA synthetase
MAGVPRVWNRYVSTFQADALHADLGRIHAAIKSQMAAGGLKGALLTKAVNAKLENWRTKGEVKHTVYDALVFRKVRTPFLPCTES